MGEHFCLALVLIVAMTSAASILSLTTASPTGNSVNVPACGNVRCPGHAAARPLLDAFGTPLSSDEGKPICICPR